MSTEKNELELFETLFEDAKKYYHPAILLGQSLQQPGHYGRPVSDAPQAYRVARHIVEATEDFESLMNAYIARVYHAEIVMPTCKVCGSTLCPEYQQRLIAGKLLVFGIQL